LPKGKTNASYPAAWFSLNGDGEMTGLPYIEDFGLSYGPVGITNTKQIIVLPPPLDIMEASFSFYNKKFPFPLLYLKRSILENLLTEPLNLIWNYSVLGWTRCRSALQGS
jgi:hypothetical protein